MQKIFRKINIRNKKILSILTVSMVIIFIVFSQIFNLEAAFNKEINYQGKLTTGAGVAVANGTYNMEFKLYTASSGGTTLWTETRTGANKVQVTNGLFSVMLGEVSTLSGVDFNQTSIYLGVNIGGTDVTPTWDGEMTPRKKLGTVPASLVSDKTINIFGGNSTTLLGSIPYQSDTDVTTLLAPNTTTTKNFLGMTGTGTNGAVPVWGALANADIPTTLTGKTYNGLTLTSLTTGFSVAGGTTSKTLTVNNTLGLSGTDGSTLNIGTGGTLGTGAFATIANYVPYTGATGNVTLGTYSLTTPNILGGTSTTQDLTLQTTSGVGATGADMHFLVGNAGGTEAMTILNNGNVGIGTTGPSELLTVSKSQADTTFAVENYSISNADVPEWELRKSNNNTLDTKTTTVNGNYLGQIAFKGVDTGNNWDYGAYILAVQEGNAGVYLPTRLDFTTYSSSASNGPVLSLNSAGKVGIGTTSPTALLHLKAGTATANTAPLKFTSGTDLTTPEAGAFEYDGTNLHFTPVATRETIAYVSNLTSGYVPYTGANANVNLGTYSLTTPNILGGTSTTADLTLQTTSGVGATGADMHFLVGNNGATEAMTILNNGNVGIGTTTPQYRIDTPVASKIGSYSDASHNASIEFYNATTANMNFQMTNSSGGAFTFMGSASPTNGNVGIGTTAPTYKLDVKGTAAVDGIRSDMGYEITPVLNPTTLTAVVSSGGGVDSGDHIYFVTFYTAFGETSSKYTGTITTTAGNNTVTLTIPTSTDPRVVGRKIYRTKANFYHSAEYLLTTITNNIDTTYIDTVADSTLSGIQGLAFYRSNKTTNYFTVNGSRSMVLGDRETYFGLGAGNAVTSGGGHTLFGANAGQSMTTGTYNIAIGVNTGTGITTGSRNTLIGYYSLNNGEGASNNVAIGHAAMIYNKGQENIAIGSQTLNGVSSTTNTTRNIALGNLAMYSIVSGGYNTSIGPYSLYGLTTGSSNISLGYQSGRYIADGSTVNTTSDYSLYLGQDTKAGADNNQNEIVIGYNAIGAGSNTIRLGNTSVLRTYAAGLNLSAGTATAGTAPLKLTSGTDLTTPEAGAFEYDGTNLHFTPVATRETIAYVSNLTSGYVPYTGATANVTLGTYSLTTPNILGGTSTTQDLTLQTTSGVGATGADMHFLVGNAGATEAMTILNNGNVGIGTPSPNNLLQVNDLITFTNADWKTQIGYQAGKYDLGQYNTWIGYQSGSANNATGKDNTADNNTAIGYRSLYSNTTGYYNTANGSLSLTLNTTGLANTATGFSA
ncbi:TPA: hypothetical protein DCX66_00960, partial [Candidatus Nomurabacteria bacterium]|nr:hypothetical protein [Candidatus Nomurabacteria bacterium]HAX65027.1 hypothetical protein [Candidatus Nomurabacteria bacterium]HCU02023.1 hypothetical protein [Candidatus Nomurabacteria bacterium]